MDCVRARLSLFLPALLLGTACRTDINDKDSGTAEPEGSAACQEAARLEADDCYTVLCAEAFPLTCTYGDVVADGDDCGCWTQWMVYDALCSAGNTDSLETLQDGLVCAP